MDAVARCACKVEKRQSDAAKKEFEELRKQARVAIAARFVEHMKSAYGIDNFLKDSENGKLLKKVILPRLADGSPEKTNLCKFEKFTVYFTGFFENRRNVFSDEAIATSIPLRIVRQNFERSLSGTSMLTKKRRSLCAKS